MRSICVLSHLIVGLLALAVASPTPAQKTARKKTPSSAASSPKPKTGDSPASGGISAEKAKSTRTPTPQPKPARQEPEPESPPSEKPAAAPNAAVAPEEIVEFHAQPAGVRKLIESGLDLARKNLTYTFGSADPSNGGMDCSGFIYYVLRQHGLTQVPRDSSGLYMWARKARGFRAVISRKADSIEMDELLPGDLLFWIGTYATAHDPPVTHTMIYLGTEKATGAKIMIGSSDGRTYRGLKRNGVSVFDFKMPRTPENGDSRSTFIGYARIPGLRD